MTRFPGVVDLRVSIFILPVIVRASPIPRHLGRWPGAISHNPSTHLCRTHDRVLSSLVSIPDQSFRCEISVVPFWGTQTGGVLCKCHSTARTFFGEPLAVQLLHVHHILAFQLSCLAS